MTDPKERATNGKTFFKLGKIAYEKSGVFKTASSDNATGRTLLNYLLNYLFT